MSPQFPTRPIAKLGGHNGPVHVVTYSEGLNQYILTGASDRTIRLFNPSKASPPSSTPVASSTSDPSLIQKYSAHGYEVLDLAIDPSNTKFLSVGGDKTVFLWDVATAQTIRRFFGHSARVNTCAFGGEDASVAVSGSYDGSVRLWDLKAGSTKPLMVLSDARDSVSDVAVVDKDIVSASVDGRIRSYDVRMGRCMVDVIGHPVTSLAPTKTQESILVSSLDSTLRLMDRANGQLLKAYRSPLFKNTDYRLRSTLGLNDAVVVSGSDDGHIFVWDVLEGEVLHTLQHSQTANRKGEEAQRSKRDLVSAVTFCRTRKEWASAGGDGIVIVWGSMFPDRVREEDFAYLAEYRVLCEVTGGVRRLGARAAASMAADILIDKRVRYLA